MTGVNVQLQRQFCQNKTCTYNKVCMTHSDCRFLSLHDIVVAAALVCAGIVGSGGLKSSGPLGGRPRFFGNFIISRCDAVVVTGGACCCGKPSLTVPVTNCLPATIMVVNIRVTGIVLQLQKVHVGCGWSMKKKLRKFTAFGVCEVEYTCILRINFENTCGTAGCMSSTSCNRFNNF